MVEVRAELETPQRGPRTRAALLIAGGSEAMTICNAGLLAGCSVGLPAHAHSTPMGEML